jgi:hypothetical protein
MRVEENVAGEQEGNKCRILGTFQIYSCYISIELKSHFRG